MDMTTIEALRLAEPPADDGAIDQALTDLDVKIWSWTDAMLSAQTFLKRALTSREMFGNAAAPAAAPRPQAPPAVEAPPAAPPAPSMDSFMAPPSQAAMDAAVQEWRPQLGAQGGPPAPAQQPPQAPPPGQWPQPGTGWDQSPTNGPEWAQPAPTPQQWGPPPAQPGQWGPPAQNAGTWNQQPPPPPQGGAQWSPPPGGPPQQQPQWGQPPSGWAQGQGPGAGPGGNQQPPANQQWNQPANSNVQQWPASSSVEWPSSNSGGQNTEWSNSLGWPSADAEQSEPEPKKEAAATKKSKVKEKPVKVGPSDDELAARAAHEAEVMTTLDETTARRVRLLRRLDPDAKIEQLVEKARQTSAEPANKDDKSSWWRRK